MSRATSHPAILFYRALEFAAAADAYVRTYRKRSDHYMVMFLLARSLELAIKAGLRARGVSAAAVRRHGHDLAALAKRSTSLGLMMIDPDVPDTHWGIAKLSEAYSSKELEYQERGIMSGPASPLLRRLVHLAVRRAALLALNEEVRQRLLAERPSRAGLTLRALRFYR